MITDYRGLTGPAYDDDCQCHCSGRAAERQDALDEIHLLLVGLTALPPGSTELPLERLVIERAVSINTTAAGGNASLMTMA